MGSEETLSGSIDCNNRDMPLFITIVPIANEAWRLDWGLWVDRRVFGTNNNNNLKQRTKRRAFRSAPTGRKTAIFCDRTDAGGRRERANRGEAMSEGLRESAVRPAVLSGENIRCRSSESPDCRTNPTNETSRTWDTIDKNREDFGSPKNRRDLWNRNNRRDFWNRNNRRNLWNRNNRRIAFFRWFLMHWKVGFVSNSAGNSVFEDTKKPTSIDIVDRILME